MNKFSNGNDGNAIDDSYQTRNFSTSKKFIKNIESSSSLPEEELSNLKPEALNSKAVAVIDRVSNKLTGKDFKALQTLDVKTQVDLLILQATSIEHLCQCYIGWCSFW
ncbi:phosphatidylinositol kinase- protein kinase tor1 [Clydaea vesicula]|uniref:Phosphatidylinositol kinase- protein kinase tor1 n=1 Tax=Clydaea vesicula TaxID=447962 RepID=A0AAD5TVA9_9FUNG|nr:phosphatidylinositol kinase- protein kinase tor1 [Clydaea vesicula]